MIIFLVGSTNEEGGGGRASFGRYVTSVTAMGRRSWDFEDKSLGD